MEASPSAVTARGGAKAAEGCGHAARCPLVRRCDASPRPPGRGLVDLRLLPMAQLRSAASPQAASQRLHHRLIPSSPTLNPSPGAPVSLKTGLTASIVLGTSVEGGASRWASLLQMSATQRMRRQLPPVSATHHCVHSASRPCATSDTACTSLCSLPPLLVCAAGRLLTKSRTPSRAVLAPTSFHRLQLLRWHNSHFWVVRSSFQFSMCDDVSSGRGVVRCRRQGQTSCRPLRSRVLSSPPCRARALHCRTVGR